MLILFQKSFKYEKVDVILCGMTIGLLALSRQWAFLLFPAYFLIYFLIKNHEEKKYYFKFLFYIFSIGFFISSWFYFGLFFEYGTFTAFNKDASALSQTSFSPTLTSGRSAYFKITFSKPKSL